MKNKKNWDTPQIESLEISAPVVCNRPWYQVEVCDEQQEPQNLIPCTPTGKGSATEALS